MANVDPIAMEIIRNRLVAATEEMAKTMIRTAFNPLLYEIQDFSVTLMSPEGDMWAETPGVIVFSQGFPNAVRDGIRRWQGNFADGDVLIVNDPFSTGTHISDTNVYMPVFFDGRLVAFSGVAAHWADVGGKNPGGWCRDTTSIFQEGLCFRHQKIVEAGVRNQGLWDVIADNVRLPTIVKGDLEAQVSACRQGAIRIQELCEKFGADAVGRSMTQIIDQTDQAMRRLIRELPDGSYESELTFDSDGVSKDAINTVKLKVVITDDQVHCSLLGSSPTSAGPINLPAPSSTGILSSTLKGILLPFDPCNAGHSKAITFELPEDSIVNPRLSAPTDSYGYTIVCMMELMFRCFEKIAPARVPAGGYQLTGAFLSGVKPDGTEFVLMDATHGGNGALVDYDGSTNQLVGNGDLPSGPTEISENRHPVRIWAVELGADYAGAGRYRGGMGIRKVYESLVEGCFVNFVIENTKDPTAIGFAGGKPGKSGNLMIHQPDGSTQFLTAAVSDCGPFPVGTRFTLHTGGGGGWGCPDERDPALIEADIRNGFLSAQQATELYGFTPIT